MTRGVPAAHPSAAPTMPARLVRLQRGGVRGAGQNHPSGSRSGRDRRHERLEVVGEAPRSPARPVAVGRRVQDDAVVDPTAPRLAGHEPRRVFDEPADRSIGETGEGSVPASPRDRGSRGVDVDDPGSRSGEDEAREARVREEIEHRRGPAASVLNRLRLAGRPARDGRVLGEEADLAGRRRDGAPSAGPRTLPSSSGEAHRREPSGRSRPQGRVRSGPGLPPRRPPCFAGLPARPAPVDR